MGMDLDLYLEDEGIESPYLSRSFKDEIVFEWYIRHSDFLTEEEVKVMSPNPLGEVIVGEKKKFTEIDKKRALSKVLSSLRGKGKLNDVDKFLDDFMVKSEKVEDRERDPVVLKRALLKTENYLEENGTSLPVVHTIYKHIDCRGDDIVGFVMINGAKGIIEGDLFWEKNYSELKDKIRIKSYLEDYGKLDFYLQVRPIMFIGNKKYYAKTTTKAEQFRSDFERCYNFLEEAIRQNRKVLWEVG